jgi:ATP-dependent Clp protease, protease subunit
MLESSAGPLMPVLQRSRDYMRQRQMSLSDLLLDHRIIFLGSAGGSFLNDGSGELPIMDVTANVTIQQFLYLQYDNRNAEIHFYINSPGGSVTATLAIYDTMQFLDCPIATYCMGLAASGAAVLLAAGSKGKRFALPNSKIMIHQPRGGIGGQVSDIEIQANEIIKARELMNVILAKHTGQSVERIAEDTRRDRYFNAQEAKEFGLVDDVLMKMA